MPRTTRRAGVLAVAFASALTASTLALPLVTAQAVVTTTEKTVYLADTSGDGGCTSRRSDVILDGFATWN